MDQPLDITSGAATTASAPAASARLCLPTVRSGACLAAYAAMAVLIGGLYALGAARGIPFSDLSRDPLAVSGGEPYFGVLSNLGILLWCAAASICLFTATAQSATRRSALKHFFSTSGILTMLLLLDDLFLLHEQVLPELFGIRQRYIILFYLLMTSYYLVYYFKYLIRHRPLLMVAALTLFAVSLGVDAFAFLPHHLHHLIEDGAKLFGIMAWCHYFVRACRGEIMQCSGSKDI